MDFCNPFFLDDKKILITGASSGIGRAIAIACSKMGAIVYLNGRNLDRLEKTKKQLEGNGHLIVAGDLTIPEEVNNFVDVLPLLDGVVHCAGIGFRKICKQILPEEVDFVMASNFAAPVNLQSILLSKKKLNKGASIVFISSIAPFVSSVGNSLYGASKGAILAYSNCLALELAPRKIRVNSICPGMVWTDLISTGGLVEDDFLLDEQKYPLKRYGTPEDVANAAIFFLSNASTWITGTSLKVAGGLIS